MSTGNKPTSQIHVTSSDRVFLRLVPLDSVVGVELSRAGLDATKTHDALLSEFHYQLFLKKQEEAQDSAGSTVRVTVTIQHLQSGSGNSGSFAAGTLQAERNGKIEDATWEIRQSAKDNVPGEFLSLHVPRMLAKEILSRMKGETKRKNGMNDGMDYNPPLMLLF
jgi:hypothetical protein